MNLRTPRADARGLAALVRRLGWETGALAMIEFAMTLPLLVLLGLTGSELANYITTKMRVSQMALQLADNASRMGVGSATGVKVVSETNINEMFTGAQLQSGNLDLATNGRAIISDLEPVANPNTTSRFLIQWQRCYGGKTSHASLYGTQGQTNMTGIGPAATPVTATDTGATMFVEIYYVYKPLFTSTILPSTTFDEIASMAVRDQRSPRVAPANVENATAATC